MASCDDDEDDDVSRACSSDVVDDSWPARRAMPNDVVARWLLPLAGSRLGYANA